mgnify:FL=1
MFFLIFLFLLNLQKNIILLVGDGFGPEQMKLIEENGYPWVSFDGFSALDTINPYCGIPDSASSATAIFSGIFTENGMLGMGINGKKYETLGEIAKKEGFSVSVITDVEIYDATPAGLYAHTKDRKEYEKILIFLRKSNFDLFIGDTKGKNIEKVIKLKKKMDYLNIIKISLKKIKSLNKPYFILIEFGKIDHFCHKNDLKKLKKELKKKRKIIDYLIEFSLKEKNTILIITADHETGGFDFETSKFKSKYHTTQPVFVFSTEPFKEMLINQPHLHRFILKFINM